MKVLVETTEWKGIDYRQPNHTYLLDGSKLVAYKKWNEGPAYFFNKPSAKFDRRYRKFKELKYVPEDWIKA